MERAKAGTGREVDLEAASKLVEALARDLETIPGDANSLQRLKDEVETLRNVLGSPVRRHHWVRDGLQGVREAFHSGLDSAASRSSRESKLRIDMPSQPDDLSSMPSTSSVCSHRRRPGNG